MGPGRRAVQAAQTPEENPQPRVPKAGTEIGSEGIIALPHSDLLLSEKIRQDRSLGSRRVGLGSELRRARAERRQ